jgi:glycolate dehydrogenase iron-sulfur subunit
MTDLRALTDTCVHCGFCLPACPTYQVEGEEMDSPRGRIHLIQQMLDGAPAEGAVTQHLDACLGCLACVPACPSGVAYDRIIADARVLSEPARGRLDRARRAGIFAVFPYPRRMTVLRGPLKLAQRLRLDSIADRWLPTTLGAMARLAPPVLPRVRLSPRMAARTAGPARAVVGLLTGCVQSAFFSHVSAATARVLTLEGCDVVIPPRQGCCGALARHTGRVRQARRQARRIVAAFANSGVDVVITDVAGCGSAMKEYAELLHDDPAWGPRAAEFATKVRDVSEFLASLSPVATRHPVSATVAYHDACHLSHGQGVRSQPRALLNGIPSLTVVPIGDADMCCGSAGVYNLLLPGPASELGARKAAAVRASGADLLAAGNPGCLLQIRAALGRDGGLPLPAVHTIEVLDASLSGTPLPSAL